MSTQKITTRNTVLVLIIVFAAAMRFVSYKYQFLSNFTPVGAIALFGGAYFTDRWKAFLVPLAALFLSDVVIYLCYPAHQILWYAGSLYLYFCFIVMVCIGTLIKKVNFTNVLLASVAGLIVHWLVMDLPWIYAADNLYPNTFAGYGHALVAAIPFEKNMVLGDLIYGVLLFGGFELAKRKYSSLRSCAELAL